jgi:hypothetical protein
MMLSLPGRANVESSLDMPAKFPQSGRDGRLDLLGKLRVSESGTLRTIIIGGSTIP